MHLRCWIDAAWRRFVVVRGGGGVSGGVRCWGGWGGGVWLGCG